DRADFPFRIDHAQSIAGTFQDVDVARPVGSDGPRIDQRSPNRLIAVPGHALLAVAGDRADGAALHVDGADAAIIEVGQVHLLALRVEGDTVDTAELGFCCRPAVATKTLLAGAREGANLARFRIDDTHAVVPGVGDVDVAIGANSQTVRPVELGLECWTV